VGRGLSNLEDAFKGALKERLPEAVYRVWFSEVGVNVRDRKLILEVANEFAKNWIRGELSRAYLGCCSRFWLS
jgi:chromosomal replication initiation ATPase DnaA